MDRSRSDSSPPQFSRLVKTLNGGPYDEFDCRVAERYKVMSDVVTPRFQARIAAGETINSSVTYDFDDYSSGGGSYRATNATNDYQTSGGSISTYHKDANQISFDHQVPSQTVEDLTDVVKFLALQDLDTTPYAMMEDLAEMRETIRFLRNPAKAFLDGARKFSKEKRSLMRHGLAAADAASQAWLTYRFALTPIVRSALDLTESLYFKRKRPPPIRVVRKKRIIDDHENPEFLYYYSPSVYDVWKIKRSSKLDVRAGIRYRVTNPAGDLAWTYGLRAKDIPETAWAIVPLSFMVDRVVNISGAIRGVTNLLDPNVQILAGWTSSRLEQNLSVRLDDQINPGYSITINGDEIRSKRFEFRRVPWSPSIGDTVPGFTPGNLVKDATAISDLFALGVTALLR